MHLITFGHCLDESDLSNRAIEEPSSHAVGEAGAVASQTRTSTPTRDEPGDMQTSQVAASGEVTRDPAQILSPESPDDVPETLTNDPLLSSAAIAESMDTADSSTHAQGHLSTNVSILSLGYDKC